MSFQKLFDTLQSHGQEHLLRFWDQLGLDQQHVLADQIGEIDFPLMKSLFAGEQAGCDWEAMAGRAEPPPAIRLNETPIGFSVQDAKEAGETAIAAGQVGMILAAGGQGTRLGFDLPKGMFEIGPLSKRTLFEVHVDRLRALARRLGTSIPLYIMTSPATDADTREYFARHDHLGLAESELSIFQQGTMPAVDDQTGRIILSSPSEIALSPNGHGGLLAALDKNGCLREAEDRGIKYFFYLQIDNPLVPVCDPTIIGYQILSQSQVLTQVVKKRFAEEKVGNVVSIDGRTQIIEYSDLPKSAAIQTNPDGSLKLWAGNIAVHVFELDFLKRMLSNKDALPFHRAHKAVPFVNEAGETVKPPSPNAYKFERFVFDLLPMAERSIVVEGDAAEVFAPVKNASGAPTDTPEATRKAISDLHKKWLRHAGVAVADEAVVEIHPSWAIDEADVRQRAQADFIITKDTYLHD